MIRNLEAHPRFLQSMSRSGHPHYSSGFCGPDQRRETMNDLHGSPLIVKDIFRPNRNAHGSLILARLCYFSQPRAQWPVHLRSSPDNK